MLMILDSQYDSYIFAMRPMKDLGLYEIRGIHYYLYKYETDTLDRGLMISEICYFCIRRTDLF